MRPVYLDLIFGFVGVLLVVAFNTHAVRLGVFTPNQATFIEVGYILGVALLITWLERPRE